MPGPPSRLEQDMLLRIKLARLDVGMVRDYRFHPTRRWELDVAWPESLIYVSIEGGLGMSSHRHVRNQYKPMRINGELVKVKVGTRDGYTEDLDKHNEAAILGWLGVRVTGPMIESGLAIRQLQRAFQIRSTAPF